MRMNSSVRFFNDGKSSTVYESRVHQEDSRPPAKKRKREEDSEEESPGDVITGSTGAGVSTRDSEWFTGPVEHDEHVFCVNDTLFKVNDSALQRCPQLKEEIYTSPSKRWDDLNPRNLAIDCSVEEFKAVLWAMHTPENQLQSGPGNYSDVDRILNLALVSKSFGLDKLYDWAVRIAQTAAKDAVFMDSCSSATLTLFAKVADRCGLDDMLDTLCEKWCERVFNKKAPSVPALLVTDINHKLAKLRGVAYYVHLQDMLERQTINGEATQLITDHKLNSGQVMRLLAGHLSLVNCWEQLRLRPIELPCAAGCSAAEHQRCSATWNRRWIVSSGWQRILERNSSDILGILDVLRDQLMNDDDLKAGVHPACRLAGLNSLKTKREDIQATLVSHFAGCV